MAQRTHQHPGKKRKNLLLWALATGAGVATWLLTLRYGSGPVRASAGGVGVLAALLVLGSRLIRFSPPKDARSRRNATLTKRSHAVLCVLLSMTSLGGVGLAAKQLMTGYRPLHPAAVAGNETAPNLTYYQVTGAPVMEVIYKTTGSEGERFIFPLAEYDGQLLVLAKAPPPKGAVTVTGMLRDDFRGHQQTPDGGPRGGFLPLYRERMGLADDTPLYFLDSSMRAGLNIQTLLLVIIPFYLFLVLIGAPTRPTK